MKFKLAIIVVFFSFFFVFIQEWQEISVSHYGEFLVFDKFPSENMLGQILKYFV